MAAELYIARAKKSFDVIFCDPPFPYKYKKKLLAAIAASPLVHPGSRILLHRPREDGYIEIKRLSLENSKNYGRSVVDFFIYRSENS
jgi:16S rRNA G966 N2-methylase RsmD